MDFLPKDEIKINNFYLFVEYIIYPILQAYYNINITGLENLPNTNKSVIFISRHSTHNYEIIPGILTLNKYLQTPIRGIGHYFVNILCPYYRKLGVVIGTRDRLNELINNKEPIFILPGGAEEMTYGHENAYKFYWNSKSGKLRTGFVKMALKNDIDIIPLVGQNTEEMVFAPLIYIANKLKITKYYSLIENKVCNKYLKIILHIIKLLYVVVFGTMLIILIPVPVTFHVCKPIRKIKCGESIEDYTKYCKLEMEFLYYQKNKRYEKNIHNALYSRFIYSDSYSK